MTTGRQERLIPTPVSTLWKGILLVVLAGVLDSKRAQEVTNNTLKHIQEIWSPVVILDIRAVLTVDTAVAQHIVKFAQATQLMGCICIVSGISPAIAQTLVSLGISLANISTDASMEHAFDRAFSVVGLELKEVKEAVKKEPARRKMGLA